MDCWRVFKSEYSFLYSVNLNAFLPLQERLCNSVCLKMVKLQNYAQIYSLLTNVANLDHLLHFLISSSWNKNSCYERLVYIMVALQYT